MTGYSKQHPHCNKVNNRLSIIVERTRHIRLYALIAVLLLLAAGTSVVYAGSSETRQASSNLQINGVIQVIDKTVRLVGHVLVAIVQPTAEIGLRGTAYDLHTDSTSTTTEPATAGATTAPQPANRQEPVNEPRYPIEITQSAWQHVMSRHTPGGAENAGKSVFNAGVDIQALIKSAETAVPVLESNGYYSRESDAGRNIGYDGQSGKQTSVYRVITTQSGKLVTAYPVVR